ncbi:DUF6900 domain-containing protein [Sinorhizobium meliloti]|uniref:DUF6900 domain-containing protein n=1 Tax=Rhizobium meliloti TaxID=382 RepID=UPI000FD939DE|nr:hypothetical protein [Sinorhizobium meliloti]MDX1247540.1 hypothetical protein [Sinorhizobium medicae]MQV80702.1 hypothetical protein [Sinorhizobium meliloti]RVL26612.1 hypothetical protein CN144_23205 [Sinorhizobium meliloti]
MKKYRHTLSMDEYEFIHRIARTFLGIRSLATRNSDALDFHNVAVSKVESALEKAYSYGYETCEEKHRERDEGLYVLRTSQIWRTPPEEVLRYSKAEMEELIGKDGVAALMRGEVVHHNEFVSYVEMFLAARKLRDAEDKT